MDLSEQDSERKKPSNIEKHENFVRLAEGRVKKTLNFIKLLGNLANKKNYVYSKNEAEKIITALEKSIEKLKFKFETDEIEFSL